MFDSHFEVFLADTNAGKEIQYKLRYQVYCTELGYENPNNFPDEMERDEYDSSSVHFLVREIVSGQWIAAMRLVIAPLYELHVKKLCELDILDFPLSAVEQCAEVSRLCIISTYRRRKTEGKVPYDASINMSRAGQVSSSHIGDRRIEPEIMLGLIRAAVNYSNANDIGYWYFLGAPSLGRLLSLLGMRVKVIGPECIKGGLRHPYFCDLTDFLIDVPKKSKRISDMFCREPGYFLFSEMADAVTFSA